MGTLYAALKRRSSTVLQGSVRAPCKIKIKIKGSGQECPLHTSGADRVAGHSFPQDSTVTGLRPGNDVVMLYPACSGFTLPNETINQ